MKWLLLCVEQFGAVWCVLHTQYTLLCCCCCCCHWCHCCFSAIAAIYFGLYVFHVRPIHKLYWGAFYKSEPNVCSCVRMYECVCVYVKCRVAQSSSSSSNRSTSRSRSFSFYFPSCTDYNVLLKVCRAKVIECVQNQSLTDRNVHACIMIFVKIHLNPHAYTQRRAQTHTHTLRCIRKKIRALHFSAKCVAATLYERMVQEQRCWAFPYSETICVYVCACCMLESKALALFHWLAHSIFLPFGFCFSSWVAFVAKVKFNLVFNCEQYQALSFPPHTHARHSFEHVQQCRAFAKKLQHFFLFFRLSNGTK